MGRDEERRVLEAAISDARGGSSAVLVVHGDAGIGKTALVEEVVSAAVGVRVVRVAGIEAEMELPYAALHRLLLPLLDHLHALPRPQYTAMGSTFGLLPEVAVPDQFLLGLATLTLIAQDADTTPRVCVVDDAQWLDTASWSVLTFVARRLLADRIALFFCMRDRSARLPSLGDLPELPLHAIDEAASIALLAQVASPIDPHVARRVVAAAGGNPLAVTEFAAALTPAQRSGVELAEGRHLPVTGRIEAHYRRRIRALSTATQTVLLLAAAEPSGDPQVLWQALEHLGLDAASIPAAQDTAGEFATFHPTVQFRHGLIRSAVYHGSPLPVRRTAHAALAQATDPITDPDRLAWHHAAAAPEPNEDIAAALERSALRAQARGRYCAESALLTTAADLTPNLARRGARLVAAAEAAVHASDYRRCQTLLGQAAPLLAEPHLLAHATRLRGASLSPLGRPAQAPAVLAAAAAALAPFDQTRAKNTWLDALSAAWLATDHAQGTSLHDVAVAALAAPRPQGSGTVGDLLLDGVATRVAVGYTEAVPILRRAAAMIAADPGDCPIEPQPLLVCLGGHEMWDCEGERVMLERLAQRERSRGSLMGLWLCLFQLSFVERWVGRLREGQAYSDEADTIRDAIGLARPWRFPDVEWHALRGRDVELREAVAGLSDMATSGIFGLSQTSCRLALTVYALSRGRYEDACRTGRAVYDEDTLVFGNHVLPELVEAASRAGDTQLAAAALHRLEVRATASGTDWARGLLSRSQALVTSGCDAEQRYTEAIDLLDRARIPLDQARAHLLYGEWLRRGKRRADAVAQLRAAYEMFTSMGTGGFADRARTELHAAGARAGRRVPDNARALTPQEEQVARLAGLGLTNREIAATMFISENTVAYHLKKSFRKLGVSSRRELVQRRLTMRTAQ